MSGMRLASTWNSFPSCSFTCLNPMPAWADQEMIGRMSISMAFHRLHLGELAGDAVDGGLGEVAGGGDVPEALKDDGHLLLREAGGEEVLERRDDRLRGEGRLRAEVH